MSEDPQICKTCTNSLAWHDAFKPLHPFNDGSAGVTAFLGKRGERAPTNGSNGPQADAEGPSRPVWPTDPVLRIALITRGILTADDLRNAEELLKASMFHQSEGVSDESAGRT